MSVTTYSVINNELVRFINYINLKKKWTIETNIYLENQSIKGRLRCLARAWDGPSKIYPLGNWDINKQCKSEVFMDNLCHKCLNKKWKSGLVSEYPDENTVLVFYRKTLKKLKGKNFEKYINRDVDEEIDLNKYQKYILNNKKFNYISQKKTYKKISNKRSSMNCKSIKKFKIKIKTTLKTLSDEDSAKIKKNLLENEDILESWWNSELTDKIQLYDSQNGSSFTFAMEHTNEGNVILNKRQVILGTFKEWEDINNYIPECHKNNENKVIDPETAIPLMEYLLSEKMSIYHNLNPGIYREYRYDIQKEELYYTDSVKLIS